MYPGQTGDLSDGFLEVVTSDLSLERSVEVPRWRRKERGDFRERGQHVQRRVQRHEMMRLNTGLDPQRIQGGRGWRC